MAPTTTVFQSIPTLLATIIAQLQANGSAITDFNIGSVARDMSESVAAVVSQGTAVADQLQLDSYLDTATGAALDNLAANNWFVPRNPAVQATGQITITRQSTGNAIVLPSGWGQLATSPAAPGLSGVAVVTTQDASFAVGQAAVTVNAQAVQGGAAGNLAAGIFLTPLAAVNGISSQNGFQVTGAFTNGVDAESDVAYRARIPIAVQGRVKGQVPAFTAAALGVPGVLSAKCLPAGSTRGDGSAVPAGSVEVYYQGSSGLLAAVQSAVTNAATANQNPFGFCSGSLTAPRGLQRLVAAVGVYCRSGTDPVALAAAVSAALQGYVNGGPNNVPTGVGGTVYLSQAVEAVLSVPGLVSAQLPFAQFSLFGSSGATDITVAGDSYASLAAADVSVTVTTIP